MIRVYANFMEVFSNWKYLLFGFIVFVLTLLSFEAFMEDELIKVNIGVAYFYWTVIFQYLISVLFAIFLPVSVYKYVKFNNFDYKNNSSSVFGTFIGVLVAGCPACSISLASYLGLAGIISFLPYHGLELKIIGSILLIYANYNILKDLNLCKIKKPRKSH